MTNYPLLDLHIGTPPLELRGATDELLVELADVVRARHTQTPAGRRPDVVLRARS